MTPNFTDDEKRLLLSEIIKTSQVDVDELARFVASHAIKPHWEQWTRMQIPPNRTVAQCMQVADQLTVHVSQLKRKRSTETASDGSAKRPSLPGGYVSGSGASYHSSISAIASAPVSIAPRPSNGHESSPVPSPPPPAPVAKKRGRPSRADKAKRDLRPLLPQHIVPRPSDHPSGGPEPRPILPAPAPVHDAFSRSPGSVPRTPLTSGLPSKRVMPRVEMSRPRVLSDGAVDRMETTRAYLGSELPPIEPQLRAGISRQSPPYDSPTTLAPLLPHNSPAAAAETPSSQATRSTPVTNSA
ncbi:hypothetical protein NLU13_7020 [Sarocladium strictum]|uniref:Uncharacterized protein n=1 Tax=Sarocladium strictum TaxID=5046 RepID=A0AA39GFQ9_SARSR|nr:hypothetical protein NLU13_7020 [Sarocladium strictum]